MALLTPDKILEYIPSLFETNISGEVDIFEKFKNIIDFDEGYIYYINPESLQLKYKYKADKKYKINDIFVFDKTTKKFLFNKSSKIFVPSDKLIKTVELDRNNCNSFVLSKLSVKSTVFGVVVLAKKESNFYTKADLDALCAVTSILAYVLKDAELSNVFKMQLKALKDGVVEKNKAYKLIKEQNEKILEADKVKSEFLANITHELRTPLNSILGYAEILDTKLYGEINEKQAGYVNDIKVSGTHLLGMINEILDMSKLEANAMKLVKSKFFISRAVDEASNIIMPIAHKKGVKIIKSLTEDFEVYADYQKVQQILYNLLSNAIKYSPENDEVEITVFNGRESFRVAIHDNGIGIDKKYHGKIFAKFVQLDSAYTKKESSTGLGLTITKELVELHNGKITLISEINNGSTFIVEIPN